MTPPPNVKNVTLFFFFNEGFPYENYLIKAIAELEKSGIQMTKMFSKYLTQTVFHLQFPGSILPIQLSARNIDKHNACKIYIVKIF